MLVKGRREFSPRSLLVVFIGPVGVGKSTTIADLAYALNLIGAKVHRGFIKTFHGVAYMLWWFTAKLLYTMRNCIAPWYAVARLNRNIAMILTIISVYIDALINIPLRILLISALRFLGYVILCEEYTYSTFFDYLYSFIRLNVGLRSYVLFPLKVIYMLGTAYKPDFIVFLDADTNVLLRRWDERGYGDPQLIYVIAQRRILNTILHGKVIYINTSSMKVNETIRTVLRSIIHNMFE